MKEGVFKEELLNLIDYNTDKKENI